MKIATTALAAALLLASSVANAGARDELAAFTKGLKGLDGQFSQQVFDARGKQKEASSGRVAVSAPRLFRWEYLKPYPQLVIADGSLVRMEYVDALGQRTAIEFENWKRNPAFAKGTFVFVPQAGVDVIGG